MLTSIFKIINSLKLAVEFYMNNLHLNPCCCEHTANTVIVGIAEDTCSTSTQQIQVRDIWIDSLRDHSWNLYILKLVQCMHILYIYALYIAP